MKDNKKEITNLWSVLLLGLSILTLVSVLVLCLYGLIGLSSTMHEQKMDELELEKEISLINNKDDWKEYINIINKNCESTHITKRYGEDEWSVFIMDVINDEVISEYIKIEDCIYNQ